MSQSYHYRMYQEEDLPGILALWEQTEWGAPTEETWRDWYIDCPNGPALVAVAINDSGQIVGQGVLHPSELVVGRRVFRSLRVAAPILRNEDRQSSLRNTNHPMYQLLATGIEASREAGFSVMYSQPHFGWLAFFRTLPRLGLPDFQDAEFGCLELLLEDRGQIETSDAYDVDLAEFGEEYCELWSDAWSNFPIQCGLVRTPVSLAFKHGDHVTLAATCRRSGELFGYTAIKKNTGLVVDMLARTTSDLATLVKIVVAKLVNSPELTASHGIDRLKLMSTPWVAEVVNELDFVSVKYKFAFACCSLDPDIATEDIAPSRWYLTPGD